MTAQVVAERPQVVDQLAAQVEVAQRDRRRRDLADEHRPQVGPVGAPVVEAQHGVELAPRALQIPGLREEAGRDRVRVRRRADPPVHGLGRHRPQLVGVAAGADHLEPLGHPDVAGVGVADRLAELGRLDAEPVAALDVAVEQRERRLAGLDQVVVPAAGAARG